MKKILIALDYNPEAQEVAERGYDFAKAMHAEVILLHVIADPIFYSSTVYSPIMGFGGYTDLDFLEPDILKEIVKSSLHFLKQTKRHLGDDLTISTMVIEGDTADGILEVAQENEVDMVIVGAHTKKWMEEFLLPSVTRKILRETTIPILIIPTKVLLKN